MKTHIFLIGLFLPFAINAQISGVITDENGETLPYVSIYVKGTTQGTTSNIDGVYKLSLPSGKHQIVYQFVGKETEVKNVNVVKTSLHIDITLKNQSTLLNEITIAADAEDPAYRVIRNAQRKRKYYQNLIKQFTCDVYVKGNQKMENAPEKIMGIEVGDLDGALDSNRQGIVYLSESISKLYFKAPHDIKEIVHSSKVSGDDSGYSFNTAREMEFNVYDKTMDFNRQLVSPIAENAMNYYKYRLVGTFYDDGKLINKIELIRKRDTDPSFYGTIYIVEDLWNVHSATVGVTALASQLYFLDSVEVEQVFVPLEEPDVWRIFSNNISFNFNLLGFKLNGNFSATYSNYDLDTSIDDAIFNKEVFVMKKESNKKDSTYWAANRPTPLTSEEKIDYVRKDSIQKVRESPAFLDSIDRKNNKFEIGDIIAGYSYSKQSKRTYWSIGSPLNSVSFNTVQGYNGNIDLSWWKYFDENQSNRIILDGNVNYGFSEKKVRVNGSITYRPNRIDQSYVILTGGTAIKQFNKFYPIDDMRNALYSLFARQNYAKYYDYQYAKIGAGKEITNGVLLRAMMGYEERSLLRNNTDLSYFYKDSRVFTPNFPTALLSYLDTDSPDILYNHKVFATEVYADIKFNQRYYVYPDRKFNAGNNGPTLRAKYRFLSGIENDISLHALSAAFSQDVTIGAQGTFSYYIEGGSILHKNDLSPIDLFHFRGNQFTLSDPQTYSNSFLALPYFSHSTDGNFFQAHIQHDFNGFILDKIPGVRTLGFGLVVGAKYLNAQGHAPYHEVHLGIDKIGWNIFRFLRFDVVVSSLDGQVDWNYRIGVKIRSSNN